MRFITQRLLPLCSSLLMGALLLSTLPAQAEVLSTTYSSNNSRRGMLFDIVTTKALTITSFDINMKAGLTDTFSVYYKSGTWSGSESDASAWTLLGNLDLTSAGSDVATSLDVGDLSLEAGVTTGLFITSSGTQSGVLRYTNGSTTYSNDDLSILAGAGTSTSFGTSLSTPRVFNGAIHYTLNEVSSPSPIPEPTSGLLAALGLCSLAWIRRRTG